MKEFFINHICTAPPGMPEFCAQRYEVLVTVAVTALALAAISATAFIVGRRMGLIR